MSELAKISLRELREWAESPPGATTAWIRGQDIRPLGPDVLALVEAVEAAQAVMWAAPDDDDDPEYHALAAALARFKDYA